MAREYYCLVSGLREFAIDGDYKGLSIRELIIDIWGELSRGDREFVVLLYNYYDIGNIINVRGGSDRFSDLGVFTREKLEAELKNPRWLPKYIADVVKAFDHPGDTDYEDMEMNSRFGHALWESYYEECSRCRCRFVRMWAAFDRNLRNIMAAYTARTKTISMSDVVVGEDYITDHLKRNSALDFGLKGEFGYIDTVIGAISDEPNLIEKEKKIDNLRWQMADEFTEFDYFNINAILAYLSKINIIHRWMSLDDKEGRAMLERLVASMSARGLIEEAEQRTDQKN